MPLRSPSPSPSSPPRAPRRRWGLAAFGLLAGVLAACGGERIPLSSVAPPLIRVLLGAPREAASIGVADAWEVTSIAGKAYANRGTNLLTTVASGPHGILFAGAPTGATALRLRPVGAFTVEMDGARHAYRGDLILRLSGARLQLVNELDLERYVVGVIGNEIGFDQAPAALKTQAVAARTYAFSRYRTSPDAPHHLTDDTASQVYKGVSIPSWAGMTLQQLELFTAESRGVVLTWRGEPFPTYYCSTCGGHTTDAPTSALDPMGAGPVFLGVPCGYCGPSKYFTWEETVPMQRLLDALKPRGVVGPITKLEWTKLGRGGWVAEVTVTYGPRGAKKVVPGKDFRIAAGLRSMHLESVTVATDGALVVRGGGWGHGVGMCQVGVQEMARKGFAPDQILRYYYPGAEFTRLY